MGYCCQKGTRHTGARSVAELESEVMRLRKALNEVQPEPLPVYNPE